MDACRGGYSYYSTGRLPILTEGGTCQGDERDAHVFMGRLRESTRSILTEHARKTLAGPGCRRWHADTRRCGRHWSQPSAFSARWDSGPTTMPPPLPRHGVRDRKTEEAADFPGVRRFSGRGRWVLRIGATAMELVR